MKILFCSLAVPYPPTTGFKVRVFNLARQLAQRHEMWLFCLARQPVAPERIAALEREGLRVVVVQKPPLSLKAKSLFYLRRLAAGVPPSFILSWEEPILDRLKQLEQETGFDAVVAEHLFMNRFALALRCPKLFVAQNVEGALAAQMAASAPLPARWWKKLEAPWIASYERRMLRAAGGVVSVSQPDFDVIQTMLPPKSHLALVENGVDCSTYLPFYEALPPAGPRMLFLGLMSYPPNADAAKWFVREIFPLILKRNPEAVINIVGGDPPAEVQQLDDANRVRVSGYIEDIKTAYQGNSIMVVPLRQGGGSRLKILEAFAAGMPVVSTGKGAEGLRVKDGIHLLIADGPVEFAFAVSRLLADRDLYMRLRKNARRLVERDYDWPAQAARLEEAISVVASKDNNLEPQRMVYAGTKQP